MKKSNNIVGDTAKVELRKFHVSSVKACIKKVLGIDERPITDGVVIYFAPGAGQEGEVAAKRFMSLVKSDFIISLKISKRFGSIAQKEVWAKTGDDFKTFVNIRESIGSNS